MTVRPHPARLLKRAGQQFDYPTTQAGVSADGLATVYYDPSLGTNGLAIAQDALAKARALNSQAAVWFGINCQAYNLIIAPLSGNNDGSGGAYHYGCDFSSGGDIYIDADFQSLAADEGLLMAELSECFMGTQAKGWDCGGSGGEALSRLCAELVSGGPNGALAPFSSAPVWAQDGKPNWIDQDEGTDQDYDSIGCGRCYLSWMMAQGFSAAQIAQAGEPAGTLESNYEALTGQKGAYNAMIAALTASNIQITNDDPFGGIAANPSGQPVPVPPAPPTPPTPPVPPTPPTPPAGTPITKAALLAAIETLPD